MIYIARYTIDINEELNKKLNLYMKVNNISLRSVAIKKCIEDATNRNDLEKMFIEIEKKINRILYRQSINKKLIEQLYVNLGFPYNEKIENDKNLKEFYIKYNKFGGIID